MWGAEHVIVKINLGNVFSLFASLFGALALEACAPINGEASETRTPTSASSATTSGGESSSSASTSGDECLTSRDPIVLARCVMRAQNVTREAEQTVERLTEELLPIARACAEAETRGEEVRGLCARARRIASRRGNPTPPATPAPAAAPTAVATAVAQPPVAPAPAPVAAPAPIPPMGMAMPGMFPGMMPGVGGGTQTPFRVTPGGTIGNMSAPDGAAPWTSQGGIMGLSEFTISLVDVPFPVEVFVNGVRVCHTQDGLNFTQVTFQGRTFCVVPPRAIGNTDLSFLANDPSRRQEVIMRGWHYNSYVGVTSPAGTVTVRVTPARYRGRTTAVSVPDFQ